eukprot:408562-Hanusia_phi.AAC.1
MDLRKGDPIAQERGRLEDEPPHPGSATREPREYTEDAVNFSMEFLNAQEPPNLPPHSLLLK